jgi:hypothetical protein
VKRHGLAAALARAAKQSPISRRVLQEAAALHLGGSPRPEAGLAQVPSAWELSRSLPVFPFPEIALFDTESTSCARDASPTRPHPFVVVDVSDTDALFANVLTSVREKGSLFAVAG